MAPPNRTNLDAEEDYAGDSGRQERPAASSRHPQAVSRKIPLRPADMDDQETVRFELNRIEIWPLVKIGALLFFLIGLIVGIVSFLIWPHPSAAELNFPTRLLSALLFTLLYTALITFGLALTAWFYNLIAKLFQRGIAFHLSKRN